MNTFSRRRQTSINNFTPPNKSRTETTLEKEDDIPDILSKWVERAIGTLRKTKRLVSKDKVTNELLISPKEILVPTITVVFNVIGRNQYRNNGQTYSYKKRR
ncbi:unnamed protein product [Pieris brassicae]|uniref:Uncharacterized protein n=1 Tax=Pieris brassicae TaxID=7116 RepID=A0A9P0TZL1_PIEBR|nr:unnamed protein product [Pieris brassicae]